jgi:geranylgeranyl reductase family protein
VSGLPSVDAIVVGAGPAGSAAAFQLAQAGRRVILLEQQQAPGQANPCGGGMAASVQRLFPFELAPAVDQVIRRVRFTWALEDPVVAELPGDAPFWIVRRRVLDAFLAERAQEAGAELRCSAAATAIGREQGLWQVRLEGGETLRARGLVIAEGSNSRHAAGLGLGPPRPRFASTVSVEVEGTLTEPDLARFEFGLVHHGFCWAFPRQGGMSIGVGTFIGQRQADEDGVLSALLPSLGLAPDAGQRRQGRLRIWDGHHPLHTAGAVVVGDAASLCDPFLAEGLRPSLMSGCRGGQALERWLGGDGQALADYSASMRRDWGDSMAWGKRIAQVFYRVPRVGYQLGIKRPTAPQRIAQILSGEMGYGDIAQRVIRRLLFQRG